MKRLLRWLKEFIKWLSEAKAVIMCFLVIAAALVLGCVTWNTEFSIRSSGYALQLIGMIFAIRGLLSVRKYFGQPLLREKTFEWLKRFPKWNRNIVIGLGTVNATCDVMSARAELWSPDDVKLPVKERISRLVKNIETIRTEQRDHFNSIDKLKRSHDEHKKEVVKSTTEIENKLRTDLESLHTNDLLTSLVGLTWLTIGITLSTLAPEIYIWLN
ncbi:MAG: hypothetical protein ACMZ64_07665 [Oleiphilus sp.]